MFQIEKRKSNNLKKDASLFMISAFLSIFLTCSFYLIIGIYEEAMMAATNSYVKEHFLEKIIYEITSAYMNVPLIMFAFVCFLIIEYLFKKNNEISFKTRYIFLPLISAIISISAYFHIIILLWAYF